MFIFRIMLHELTDWVNKAIFLQETYHRTQIQFPNLIHSMEATVSVEIGELFQQFIDGWVFECVHRVTDARERLLRTREALLSHFPSAFITREKHAYNEPIDLSKPIESSQTCISMALLRHQRASVRLWSTLMRSANCWEEITWLCWKCHQRRT